MEIIKYSDHYLLQNHLGSYHISKEDFENLGKEKAIELATSEIIKKNKLEYTNETINFKQARALGFCQFGIKDFCNKLNLNIDKEYKIQYLKKILTLDLLKQYPNECIKLFGKSIINKFGGAIEILKSSNGDSGTFYFICDNFVNDDILHKFSIKAAYYVISNFEKQFPNDRRPRNAIETKERYINGNATLDELTAAQSAAWSAARSAQSAARSAAWSAAQSAQSAARSAQSAAESAAWSAAWSAAESAAESARSAAYIYFANELIKLLEE